MAPGQFHYNWHIRALTVPGPDTDLALFVAFDHERFLFGAGEGAQRAFTQKKVSLRGLSAVFIGDGGSKGRGGLPGLLMTAADAGISKLDIVGPPDVTHHLATFRASMGRGNFRVTTHPHPPERNGSKAEDIYESACLKVRSIALQPEAGPSSPPQRYPAFLRRQQRGSAAQVQGLAENYVRSMFPDKNPPAPSSYKDHNRGLNAPSSAETSTQMVYICKAPAVPGKFDVEKSNALKIPKGPLRGRLVKGETIEFEDPDQPGAMKVVKPEDVVGGGMEGATLIVINCSKETLPALLDSPVLHAFQAGRETNEEMQEAAVVVHRVPTSVWQDPAYLEWLKAFGPKTQHLIADTEHYRNDVPFSSAAWNTLQLSLIDNEIFPLSLSSTSASPDASVLPSNATILLSQHQKKIYPEGPLHIVEHAERDIPYPEDIDGAHTARRNLLKTMPEFAMECAKARAAVRSDPRWGKKPASIGEEIVVTTLGTGSALPSKYRNVSSTHLDIPRLGGILLDAGEGTLGQLRRRYGQEIQKVYEDLKIIFISHMHADHHLGLQAVLEDRFKRGVTSKLYLIAPIPIATSLSESGAWSHNVSQEALDDVIWVDSRALELGNLPGIEFEGSDLEEEFRPEEFKQDQRSRPLAPAFRDGLKRWPSREYRGAFGVQSSREAVADMKEELGFDGIRTPRMNHRGRAWGLVLSHSLGWKIAYSGDTVPCPRFIRAGQGATLMIHEATLDDDKEDIAKEKGHSTFSQAIEVGRRMNASYTLLNHFSQRYPKAPKSRQKTDEEGVVSISFDLMSIKVGEMWRMKYYMDAVNLLFASQEDDDDVTGAVKADFNPTLDRPAKGAGVKNGNGGKGGKGGAGGRGGSNDGGDGGGKRYLATQAQNSANVAEEKSQEVSPPKRQASPSGSTPLAKKSKSESSESTTSALVEETVL